MPIPILNLPLIDIKYTPRAYAWDFVDDAARIAATGLAGVAFDGTMEGKLARVHGATPPEDTIWMLVDYTGPTWTLMAGDFSAVSAAEAAARAAADAILTASIASGFFARRLAKSANYTLIAGDINSLVDSTANTWTLALTAAATLTSGFAFGVFNSGSGVLTVDPNSTETIRDDTGSHTTAAFAQGEGGIFMCDGAGFLLMRFRNRADLKTYFDTLYAPIALPVSFQLSCSDLTNSLATGTGVGYFRAPHAFTLTGVRASVIVAPTGGTLLTVNIKKNGTTVLSTQLTFDASEKTTTTAATPAVISVSAIADDDEITIDIVSVGSTIAGKGLVVSLIGTKP